MTGVRVINCSCALNDLSRLKHRLAGSAYERRACDQLFMCVK